MNQLDYLEKIYNKLYSNLLRKYKSEKHESLLIWFFDIKSLNERFRLLNDSALDKVRIPNEIFSKLLSENLIRETDTAGKYTITAQGIWQVEKNKNIVSEELLLQKVDGKFFDLYTHSSKSLSEKHKTLIFSMIAGRAFSEKSTVDLKKGTTALDVWEDIINKSYDLLVELGAIKNLKKEKLFGLEGNDHKVCNIFRHADPIPPKTKGIFKAIGGLKYYLDLYSNDKFSSENLKFLFEQILENQPNIAEVDKICDFCEQISMGKNIYLFDRKEHIFHKPKFDIVIRDTLLIL